MARVSRRDTRATRIAASRRHATTERQDARISRGRNRPGMPFVVPDKRRRWRLHRGLAISKRRHHTQLSRFIVGDLQVHPDRGCVVRNGVDIPLEPRPIQVLDALARKVGEAMTLTQLQIAIWKTDHGKYDDNAVTKALSGDAHRRPRFDRQGRSITLHQRLQYGCPENPAGVEWSAPDANARTTRPCENPFRTSPT